jgi:hypothetical protein
MKTESDIELENKRLHAELETLRIQLAACGVGAMTNSLKSGPERLERDNPYWSASLMDVYSAVDREMALRTEVEQLRKFTERPVSLADDDRRDTYSNIVDALHPLQTGRHDLMTRAMELVSCRRSKYGLVYLVNALLAERAPRHVESVLNAAVNWVRTNVSGVGAPSETDLEEMQKWALKHGVTEPGVKRS